MSKPFRIGFEGMFAKKEGQWDCSLCFVRNEASATHCIACQYPNKQNQPTSCVSAPASSETSRSPKSGFEGLFPKKEGEWECAVCSVQNESSSLKCVACEASKPTHKPHEAPSAFTVGSKSQSNESAGSQVGTEFKSNFPEKNFKVGISEQKFKFGHVDQEKHLPLPFRVALIQNLSQSRMDLVFAFLYLLMGLNLAFRKREIKRKRVKNILKMTLVSKLMILVVRRMVVVWSLVRQAAPLPLQILQSQHQEKGFNLARKTLILRDFQVQEKNYSRHKAAKWLRKQIRLLISRKMMMHIRLRTVMTSILSQ